MTVEQLVLDFALKHAEVHAQADVPVQLKVKLGHMDQTALIGKTQVKTVQNLNLADPVLTVQGDVL